MSVTDQPVVQIGEMQIRAYEPGDFDLEVRGDSRIVRGICVPYDSPVMVPDPFGAYEEVFRRGAFHDAAEGKPSKVKFLRNHDRHHLLGRAEVLREETRGLYGEFLVSQTRAGDETLAQIRDGSLDGLSVGFFPKESIGEPGVTATVERVNAKLFEVSATAFPHYEGAEILGLRERIEAARATFAERRELLMQLAGFRSSQ